MNKFLFLGHSESSDFIPFFSFLTKFFGVCLIKVNVTLVGSFVISRGKKD